MPPSKPQDAIVFSAKESTVPPISVAQMQALDARAIEELEVPRLLLMDHAGQALATIVMAQRALHAGNAPITICCGMGFNGGDGLSAARHLHAWGETVQVLLVAESRRLRPDPAIFLRMVEALKIPVHIWSTAQIETIRESGILVDALLGIGITGQVRAPYTDIIECMNSSGVPIVAADIPSGLDGDDGRRQGSTVQASATVTFGRIKRGCVAPQAASQVGKLWVAPITFPRVMMETGT